MINLSQLENLLDGQLRLGAMPSREGDEAIVGPVVIDSRQVQSDDVFWALTGVRHNGAYFAEEAFMRGAAGVVLEGRDVEPWAGRWTLRVDNTQAALWKLASWHRSRFAGDVIAVTGSVGKTTSRNMIATVLAGSYRVQASPKNYNNHIGVPLSLLRCGREDRYAVIEMAASGMGEIARLAGLARPSVGVISKIGEAHLGGFGDSESLVQAKCELLTSLPRDGVAVLNGDDPALRRIAARHNVRCVWVGRRSDCHLTASELEFHAGVLKFQVDRQRYQVPVWGRHHLTSALAAIAIGRLFGIRPAEIAGSLATFQPIAGRCRVLHAGPTTVLDDSYNASPTAMEAALATFREMEVAGRRVVVCGDMRELGRTAEHWHRRLGEQVVAVCGADMLIACGEHSQTVVAAARRAGMPQQNAIACQNTEDGLTILGRILRPGDGVMVKGSRAMGMERVVKFLQHDMWRTPEPLAA